jgi:hypothetical protein
MSWYVINWLLPGSEMEKLLQPKGTKLQVDILASSAIISFQYNKLASDAST